MDVATKVEQVIRTAEENLCKGVILEPRFYFDELAVPSGIDATNRLVRSHDGVFKNGEDYPVRITRMVAALRLRDEVQTDENGDPLPEPAAGAVVEDERLLQRIGVRLSLHGTDYMSRDFSALPLWHSRPSAMAGAVAMGLSSYRFDVPWVLSARDTLKVNVQLDYNLAPNNAVITRKVVVAFTGYGIQTKRPYYKAGEIDLATTLRATIRPSAYRNDGDEPICITDMTVHCSAGLDDPNPQGDVRYCRVQVQQVGNGTQAGWVSGPSPSQDLMPGTLFGLTAGRAVVHEFPRPLIWEPGEGLHAEAQSLVDNLYSSQSGGNVVLALGFAGSIAVI